MSNLCLIGILSYLPARLTLKVKVGTYRQESWRVSENKGFGYRGDDVTWSIDVNWYVSRGGNLRWYLSMMGHEPHQRLGGLVNVGPGFMTGCSGQWWCVEVGPRDLYLLSPIIVVIVTTCFRCDYLLSSSLHVVIISFCLYPGFKVTSLIKFVSWVDKGGMEENTLHRLPTSWVPPSISSSPTPWSSENQPPTSLWKRRGGCGWVLAGLAGALTLGPISLKRGERPSQGGCTQLGGSWDDKGTGSGSRMREGWANINRDVDDVGFKLRLSLKDCVWYKHLPAW